MALKVDFSGETKQIVVKPGVTEIDVKLDLYSDWKEWVLTDSNAQFLPAFRTFGGDPTISGQFAPSYFFLINDWKVVVGNGEDVSFGVNLYSDDGGTPFIVGSGSSVTNRNSDAVTVDVGVEQNLDYGGEIHINGNVGLPGVTYPSGTLARPVDNIADALVLANNLGISTLKVYGNVVFDQNVNDFLVIGGNFNTRVVLSNINTSGTTFERCLLSGSHYGEIRAYDCELESNFYGLNGVFNHCGIKGDLFFDSGINSIFTDCYANTVTTIPSVHMNNDINVTMKGYTGELAVYDSVSGSSLNVAFNVGQAYILTGNTSGQITLLGIASFTNESSGTTVNTTSLLVPYDIATQHLLNVNTEILRNK